MNPPILEELEETRKKLIEDIKKGEKLFPGAEHAHELCTVRFALKHLEDMIDALNTGAGGK